MILLAEVECKLEKQLKFDQVVTEENSVICLTNTGDVDISGIITKVGRSSSVNKFDT